MNVKMTLSKTACSIGLLIAAPMPALAQWYAAGTIGANHSQSSTIVINRPSADTRVKLSGVEWNSESWVSPQYYGYRFGRLMRNQRWGLEFEFVHPKMFGITARTVHISGTINGAAVDTRAPMDTIVPRYAMSHGMNVATGNLVRRWPFGSNRGALAMRIGAGLAIPHNETTMDGLSEDHYELGGFAAQGAAGGEVHLARWFWAMGEYKLSWARPRIAVAGGTGQTTALIHQVAFGPVIRF